MCWCVWFINWSFRNVTLHLYSIAHCSCPKERRTYLFSTLVIGLQIGFYLSATYHNRKLIQVKFGREQLNMAKSGSDWTQMNIYVMFIMGKCWERPSAVLKYQTFTLFNFTVFMHENIQFFHCVYFSRETYCFVCGSQFVSSCAWIPFVFNRSSTVIVLFWIQIVAPTVKAWCLWSDRFQRRLERSYLFLQCWNFADIEKNCNHHILCIRIKGGALRNALVVIKKHILSFQLYILWI